MTRENVLLRTPLVPASYQATVYWAHAVNTGVTTTGVMVHTHPVAFTDSEPYILHIACAPRTKQQITYLPLPTYLQRAGHDNHLHSCENKKTVQLQLYTLPCVASVCVCF